MITLQFQGVHTIFDYQIRGSRNIAEVPLEIYEPLFPKYGDLIINLFIYFFEKSNFQKQ